MKKEAKALIWYISILNVDIDWWRRFVVRKERKVWVYDYYKKEEGGKSEMIQLLRQRRNELHPISSNVNIRHFTVASIVSPYVLKYVCI